jgi:hypothetical protein
MLSLTPLRKQQILLIRIALEDFYNEFNDTDSVSQNYNGLSEDLVQVDGNTIRFITEDKKILTNLVNNYITKELKNGGFEILQRRYPLIKDNFEVHVKTGGKIQDIGFSQNAIDDALAQAIDKSLISDDRVFKKRGVAGLNFSFSNFQKNRSLSETWEKLQQTWGLNFKSSSLKKNEDYEIPTQFMSLIEYHTQYFIERKVVIQKFEGFMRDNPCGYFILQGEPGIGKTAMLAHYTLNGKCPCYFIQRAQGINEVEDFLDNICEQLCFKYYEVLGYLENECTDYCNVTLFNKMLQDLSKHLKTKAEKLVIVIDALDEAIQGEGMENLLRLPMYVPEGIYFLMSQRPMKILLESEAPLHVDNIKRLIGEGGWKQDFRKYFEDYMERSITMKGWVTAQMEAKTNECDNQEKVIEYFVIKSERNFRFLKNILNDIERGLFTRLEELPKGLLNYYHSHLNLMGINSSATPAKFSLLDLLVRQEWVFAKELPSQANAVIEEWEQFLDAEGIGEEARYRLYHPSFSRFISESRVLSIYTQSEKI